MSNTANNPVASAARLAWKPQDLRTAWEWAEENIVVDNTSPLPGPWRSANSPWVKEVMEVNADRRVKMIAVKCSAQSSKTQTVLNLLCYDIAEDPGPEMYVMANKEDAADFVRDRFLPTLMSCKPAAEVLRRSSPLSFTFTTMPLYFVGAGSMAKLQGKPMRRLKLDEVRNYPPGALATVLKRVRAFNALSQVFMISTPDKVGDEIDTHFLQGDQRTWHFPCPSCGHIQQLRFAQLKAIHPETGEPCNFSQVPGARVNIDQWNFDILAPWLRYFCENTSCQHPIADTPAERKAIGRNGRFIRMNPNAPAHHVSFTWNAMLPWWVSFRSIVEEFINARAAARRGDINPMKTFINETLGESWEDRLGVVDDYGFLEARKRNYDFGEVWPEEKIRFIYADKQAKGGEHYRYLVRAFGLPGQSRLITYGTVRSLLELEEVRKSNNVKVVNAMIDTAYKASEVYPFCLSTGWKAFKGDKVEFYLRTDPRTGKTKQYLWKMTHVDPFCGTREGNKVALPLYLFASDATKDELMMYMTGQYGDWTIPMKTGRDYMEQITAERREEDTDSFGRLRYFYRQVRADNHYFDCENGITIAAKINGFTSQPLASETPPKA